MPTTHRFAAATAAVCFALLTPVAASASPAEPPAEPPVEQQWPPASTHGAFLPLPSFFSEPQTVPACDSELTLSPGDVNAGQYRALITPEGDTVVEYRDESTVDITRASDGAVLDEVDLSGTYFDIYSADGTSITYDWAGPSIVVAFDEFETAAFAEQGLPQAFLYLSGRLTETVTFASAPEPGQEVPPVVAVEITENSTEYVFDLCDLLDQAAQDSAGTAPSDS